MWALRFSGVLSHAFVVVTCKMTYGWYGIVLFYPKIIIFSRNYLDFT